MHKTCVLVSLFFKIFVNIMHVLSYFTLILPTVTFYLITIIFQYLWMFHHTVCCVPMINQSAGSGS